MHRKYDSVVVYLQRLIKILWEQHQGYNLHPPPKHVLFGPTKNSHVICHLDTVIEPKDHCLKHQINHIETGSTAFND